MRSRKIVRCIGVGLAVVMSFSTLVGCSKKAEEVVIEPMEAEESVAISFDNIGGKDVMPLGGYYAPKEAEWGEDGLKIPDTINEKTYQLIEDCGINILLYSITSAHAIGNPVQKMLDLGYAHGIGTFVYDTRVSFGYGENSKTVDEMTTFMSEYMNHPGYAGMYLADEPRTDRYSNGFGADHDLANFIDLYDKLARQIDTFTYFNLLPLTDMDKKDDYVAYVEEYIEKVKPEYLSYDKYPFEKANLGKEDCYFYNLSLMRDYAQQYKIPLWTFMQCGDQWFLKEDSVEYWPNEWQFDWQVNTNLAFGVQGIQYYSLLEVEGSAVAKSQRYDSYRSGLIGVEGNKNQWYYYAQEINEHIKAIDHVLMNSVNKGVIASGKKASWATSLCSDKTMIEGTAWRELTNVEGEALVGCFNYQGKTALYVVNYSTEYAQNIKLSFADKYDVTVFQQAEASHYNADSLTLDMPAGDGVLIVFDK